MSERRPESRLVAILWFVAAGLALTATVIRWSVAGEPRVSVLVGGLFCLAMGIAALVRQRMTRPPV